MTAAAAEQREDRHAEHRGADEQSNPRPGRLVEQDFGVRRDPRAGGDAARRDARGRSGTAEHFQTSRSAMRPNATGKARSATHTGTPRAISFALSSMDLKEPQAAEREDRRDHRADERGGDRRRCAAARPSGSIVPVASVSSLPSRAAIAAPTSPTMSVRCAVNGAAPGMPVLKKRRSTISPSGSTMMPIAASVARRSSARAVRARCRWRPRQPKRRSSMSSTAFDCPERVARARRRRRRRRLEPCCRAGSRAGSRRRRGTRRARSRRA